LGVDNMLKKAKRIVVDYHNAHAEQIMGSMNLVAEDDVFIVWFCKTLQNWKALVSTVLDDGMYYEVTYNGDKEETYLDAYKKSENVRIPD